MTGTILREGKLEIDFRQASDAYRLDAPGVPLPFGMSLVDWVVEREEDVLLIEVKDPSNSRTPEREREKFVERLKHKSLIHEELVPKARDSYTYLHLMEKDHKPFVYVVLFGLSAMNVEETTLSSFTDRLRRRLHQETDVAWKRRYVRDTVVLTEKAWERTFPEYPLRRLP